MTSRNRKLIAFGSRSRGVIDQANRVEDDNFDEHEKSKLTEDNITLQNYVKLREGEFEETLIKLQLDGFEKFSANREKAKLTSEGLANRLAMVASVEINGKNIVPVQAFLEGNKVNKAWNVKYLSHGWHRYIGRFPPQVIRSLLNSFQIAGPCLILDPFVGSGTTLVEAKLLGLDAVGVDICPLSHLISEVKANLDFEPSQLKSDLLKVEKDFIKSYSKGTLDDWSGTTPANCSNCLIPDFPNKDKWFSPDVLKQLSVLLSIVKELPESDAKFFYVAVSACMRSIANVDVDVVRTEYRRIPRENVDVLRLVANKIKRYINDLTTYHNLNIPNSNIVSKLGDARKLNLSNSSVDFIVTSPPYGIEAVSYLRTHMLSYRVLYHILKTDYKEQGKRMIGTDFVTDVELHDRTLFSPTGEAFFRNLTTQTKSDSSRVAQMIGYFQDMEKAFAEMARVLKENCFAVVVIGNKKLLGQKIPTHKIFSEIAEQSDLTLKDTIPAKLVCNNPTAVTPWSERAIQDEYLLIYEKS